MATNNSLLDSFIHRAHGISAADYVVQALLLTGIPALVGIGSYTLLGYDTASVIWSGSGWEVTIGFVLVAASFVISWMTNQADDFSDFDEIETAAVIGGVIVAFGVSFVPAIGDLITGSDVWGIVGAAVLYGAYTVLAYK